MNERQVAGHVHCSVFASRAAQWHINASVAQCTCFRAAGMTPKQNDRAFPFPRMLQPTRAEHRTAARLQVHGLDDLVSPRVAALHREPVHDAADVGGDDSARVLFCAKTAMNIPIGKRVPPHKRLQQRSEQQETSRKVGV